MQSFSGTLKNEKLHRLHFSTISEARGVILDYIKSCKIAVVSAPSPDGWSRDEFEMKNTSSQPGEEEANPAVAGQNSKNQKPNKTQHQHLTSLTLREKAQFLSTPTRVCFKIVHAGKAL